MSTKTKYIINPKVFTRKINNRAVVLKEGEDVCRELNETAALIWELLQKGKDREIIVRVLTREYAVSENVARNDIKNFIEEYVRLGLLIKSK